MLSASIAPRHNGSDLSAMKNRRADQWRDVHKHEHGRPGDFDNMSDDELRTYVAGRVAPYSGESGEGTRKTRGSRKAGEQLN